MKYYTSDFHLAHPGIIKLSDRPFKTIEEMDAVITRNMFDLSPGSHLYILGDIAWNQEALVKFLNQKPKSIHLHLITGNHDRRLGNLNKFVRKGGFESVVQAQYLEDEGCKLFLLHYPMGCWNKSFHQKSFNLYGHIHKNTPQWKPVGKQMNVNCEYHDYKPWSIDQIIEYMEDMPENWEIAEIKKRDER